MISGRGRKTLSPLGEWIVAQYGGTNPKESFAAHAEQLALEASGPRFPVSLASVATRLGIAPKPIYRRDSLRGALVVVDNRLRIVIRSDTGRGPAPQSIAFRRARFTYAHELAHSFFYDLSATPPRRVAPRSQYREEEALCNAAASAFLMPTPLLATLVHETPRPEFDILDRWATLFQVSVHAVALLSGPLFADKINADEMYLLSRVSKGLGGTGEEKLRCMVCILPHALAARGVRFLGSYQGIDRITLAGSSPQNWSLQAVDVPRYSSGDEWETGFAETVKSPGGDIFEMSGVHSARRSYIWTRACVHRTYRERKS